MCDFSGRLIAWMDRELPDDEAAEVERHVRDCSECRGRVGAYEQVSHAFAAYCDAEATAKTARLAPQWVPVLASAAATVALLLIFWPSSSVKSIPVYPQVADIPPAVLTETAPRPVERVHRRHPMASRRTRKGTWVAAGPAIQIVIPVEAMFPPGAVPEGTTFIADVRMAADGSVQGLRLQ
jgi:anti-sigma factor RsiW